MAKKKKEGIIIKIYNTNAFKTLMDTLEKIIDETIFLVSKDKLIIDAMDPSHICILHVVMGKECFKEFYCFDDYHLPLNLEDFNKIIRRCSSDDTIEISYTPDQDNIIKIIMINEKKRKRTFRLKLIELEYEDFSEDNKIFKIEYSNEIIMDTIFFSECIQDAEIYSEILHIDVIKNKKIKISSNGVVGDMMYELPTEIFKNADLHENTASSFSINFLKAISKIFSITEVLKIYLKTDHPFKIEALLSDGTVLYYFLAPRVEGDDTDDYVDNSDLIDEPEEEDKDEPKEEEKEYSEEEEEVKKEPEEDIEEEEVKKEPEEDIEEEEEEKEDFSFLD